MSISLPQIYLARHGETAWTVSGQHTGLTDIPLTENGERNARRLGERLRGLKFTRIITSPLQRRAAHLRLAGYGDRCEIDADLVEWNYGDYEGLTSAEILKRNPPGWLLFRDGCPGGESVEQVGTRADRVSARVRAIDGDVLLFSSGHFSRVLAARWCGFDAAAGRCFVLGTAALSILGYEHDKEEPVIRLWNDTRHVAE